jgi:hypothetical protein
MLLFALPSMAIPPRARRRPVREPTSRPGDGDGRMARGSHWYFQIWPSVTPIGRSWPSYRPEEFGPPMPENRPSRRAAV